MKLEGKTAIVTGGASGFGEGIVRKFVAEGARVMIADINAAAAVALTGELGQFAQETDVSGNESVALTIDAAIVAFGMVDILVNNAGVTHRPMPMEDVSEADFDRVLGVNVKSVYLTARHLVPH